MSVAPSVQTSNDVAPGCETRLISDAAQLEELETEWKVLFDVSPTASPPLRWEWVREWWRIYGARYGDRGRGLRIITVRRGPDLIGVLPLYQRSTRVPCGARQLRFISTGEAEFEETCALYVDLLHAPDEARPCIEALSEFLNRLAWDDLCLSGMAVHSPLLGLRERLVHGIRRGHERTAGPCYLFDISGGFEAYLGRLSHENRRQARKLLRSVEQAGMTFDRANDQAAVDQFFDQLVSLHTQRWAAVGRPGCFAPRFAEFHRRTARLLAPGGGVVLARLALDGVPFALLYGHRVRETLHCYQQGVVPESKTLRSPGTAAWLLLMRSMAEQGVTLFDHQAGKTTFKERFATGEHPLAELRVAKPNLRYAATTVADLAKRAAAKLAHHAKRLSPAGLQSDRATKLEAV